MIDGTDIANVLSKITVARLSFLHCGTHFPYVHHPFSFTIGRGTSGFFKAELWEDLGSSKTSWNQHCKNTSKLKHKRKLHSQTKSGSRNRTPTLQVAYLTYQGVWNHQQSASPPATQQQTSNDVLATNQSNQKQSNLPTKSNQAKQTPLANTSCRPQAIRPGTVKRGSPSWASPWSKEPALETPKDCGFSCFPQVFDVYVWEKPHISLSLYIYICSCSLKKCSKYVLWGVFLRMIILLERIFVCVF